MERFFAFFGKTLDFIVTALEEILQTKTNDNPMEPVNVPIPPPNPDVLVAWDSQQHNFHNVRVLCDLSGLTLDQKNIICACVYQESTFLNYLPNGKPVMHDNGFSKDWGLCQINDHYHIGANLDFLSVDYVLANPDKCVQFMINCYKGGHLGLWSSYKTGAYLRWLDLSSPMWSLRMA